MKQVGFIGLGLMGGLMAANVARAGYPLTVYNRTPDKAEPLRALGARVAGSPREVAQNSDVIVTMLSDAAAVEAVLVGEDGILAGARPGMVLIDMSTIAPEQSRRIAGMLEAHGLKMLDAPVSGSTGPAREGTLGIMVGGDETIFEAHRDVLSTMGRNIFYMGPQGSGAVAKLCYNLMVAAQVVSLAEAMTLAASAGLDLQQMGQIITSSVITSNLLERKLGNIINGEYAPAFPLKHMHKDLGLVVQTAASYNAALFTAGVMYQLYTAARASGYAEEDFSALFKVLAGLRR